MMKNIVFIVESYLRTPNANGICIKNVANELIRKGNSVNVFTSFRGINQPKRETVDGVQVQRFKRSLLDYLYLYLKQHNNKFAIVILGLIRFKMLLLTRFWPLTSPFLILKYYFAILSLCKKQKVEVVVGVYLHIEEVLAALLIKKRFPNIKCVIYSLDGMGGRIPKEKPDMRKFREIAIRKWEFIAVQQSDIFCAMESHRDYFSKNTDFPSNKITFVDIPLITVNDKEHEVSDKLKRTKNDRALFQIVYTGTITQQVNNPLFFIDLLNDITGAELHLYGTVDSITENIIRNSVLYNTRIFIHGKIEQNLVRSIQINADALITFGSDNPNMIPCKIFEYIQSNRPIINVYEIENDSARPYLNKYHKSLQVSKKTPREELISVINAFIERAYKMNLAPLNSEEVFYENTPLPFIELILN